MKKILVDFGQRLKIVVTPTLDANNDQQDYLTTQQLTQRSQSISFVTEAHFDDNGDELVEARDFGIGTEGGLGSEDLEALALEDLQELNQLGLIYDSAI